MAKLKEDLWKTLQDLKEDEFEAFKWFLKQDGVLEGFSGIPVAQLEKAKRQDTVDLMVQKHQDDGARKLTINVLEKISRNDLVQRVQSFSLGPKGGAQKEEYTCKVKTPKQKWAKQFAVEVTLDPDTAHPHLVLSDDGKQVHHGDVRKKLPNNPNRFYRCVNVLGKQSFSSGRFYFEVQVKQKTAWTLGVAEESIERKGGVTLAPEYGLWTLCLENGDEYKAIDDPSVRLSLNHQPQKVGVFVDYEEGLVSFYDVDAADLLYSFTGCSFTEKIYPFFSPCTNDGDINSAPLIISPVSHPLNLKTSDQIEEHKRKKAELKSVQQFALEVTLDPDTAHPHLVLSDDGKQVYCGDVKKKLPNNPNRFYRCVNVLGKQSFSSGRFYFEVQVKQKTAWTLGVAKESIERKGDVTLAPENGFWTMWLRNEDEYKAIDEPSVRLSLKSHPQKVGVFVDYEEGLVSFYDVDAADLLYSFTGCSFTEKIYPFFSPCTNDGDINTAPLIISPVSHPLNLKTSDQIEEHKRKKAELKSILQFAVDVTLDPDTAHPHLVLSDDGKQVHHGDVRKKLPNDPNRFYRCVNVLGKQSFSSGRFYFEIQVKQKTAWTLGVAKESIDRKGNITLAPKNGFWTMWLRNEDEYKANDNPSVSLSLNHQPQKVGVFVDYEDGLVSFYDVDAADLLYSFTGCSFTEKIYPYFSPCTNDCGRNSAPLIISPVLKTPDFGVKKEENERKKAELMRIQQFAVEVTLDPDTAHPALNLSDDRKQVNCGVVYKELPDNPKRFKEYVNILGKQSFSSGRFYFEVQVKGKTEWDIGVAKKSIDRKGNITLAPKYGFWMMWLRNEDEYKAIDDPSVRLSLNHQPQKVGVFVDYEEGLVSFYDVDAADLLYSFTGCSFTEKIYPFFSPCKNDGGRNSAPLIISPVLKTPDFGDQEEENERKKAELMRIQQFAVEVTLDPDTAHPALNLSDNRKQVNCGVVYKELPDNPKRFKKCVNILGKQSFSSGRSYYEVQVKGKTSWTVGVAKESIDRKGNITLAPENGFWTMWLRNEDEYKANDNPSVSLSLNHQPQKVGVFVDYEEGLVSFYDVDSADHLYSFTGCSFTEKIYPFFSPCTNDGGINTAPLIISPVSHPLNLKTPDQIEEHKRKKAELKSVQQFALEVTLDPDTAHPNLILSDDGKQVHHGDVRKKLPNNPERFYRCVNVLGKQSFSSGRFYFEVQVKQKTAWTLGVAKESIERKGDVTLAPENGFWTMWLRNEDEYEAIDEPSVSLSLNHQPQKVGVFVDYEEGLVSFYDVDAADLIYSFTGCSFTEKIYPYFSPCTNDCGRNSVPLIICPVKYTSWCSNQ